MKTTCLIFGFLSVLTSGCQKPPPITYTVQGSFFNGTTNNPYPNQTFRTTLTAYVNNLPHYQNMDVTTDKNGKFNFTYTDASPWAFLSMNFGLRLIELRARKNIDSTFVISTFGKIKINLATSVPLEAKHDTLFIAHYNPAGIVIWDTITHTCTGFYRELTFAPPNGGISYGRGYNQIHSWPWYNDRFYSLKNINFNITGDPVVDSTTIKY